MAERTPEETLAVQGPAVERVQALVNLAAIERNCRRLRAGLGDGAELCAVVKADGYGHGAVPVALAALAGGAGWLAVAGAHELRELRGAGLQVPILVMAALTPVELAETLAARGGVVVWDERDVAAVASAGGGRVPVKLDSGIGRLGTRHPEQASAGADHAELGPGDHVSGADEPLTRCG